MAEVMTGRRALCAVLQRTTSAEVGARVRVSPRAVRHWSAGERMPTPEHREKLECLYGVPRSGWGALGGPTDS